MSDDLDVFDETADDLAVAANESNQRSASIRKAGIREGVSAGREDQLQTGFNAGLQTVWQPVIRISDLRGRLSAASHLIKATSSGETGVLADMIVQLSTLEDEIPKWLEENWSEDQMTSCQLSAELLAKFKDLESRAALSTPLLPRKEGEFAKKEYWDKFFKARGNKAFEWYGEYTSLVAILARYVKKVDRVLVIGCGNSDLSAELYDHHGCRDVTSIDISEMVIEQMTRKHCSKGRRPGMSYQVVDVTKLSQQLAHNEEIGDQLQLYSCILDKGTLDAMHSGADSETTVTAMFQEISVVLKTTGRYICITLAQKHIVESLLAFFAKYQPQWVIRCSVVASSGEEQQSSGDSSSKTFALPVFAFVFVKFAASVKFRPIFEVQNDPSSDKLTRLPSAEALTEWIEGQQNAAIVRNSLSDQSEAHCSFLCPRTNQVFCLCYLISSPSLPQDKSNAQQHLRHKKGQRKPKLESKSKTPYAVFIVPFGSHRESTFSTEAGRHALLESINADRLLCILLNPRLYYLSDQHLQDALSPVAMQFAPSNIDLKNKIPFLSTGTTYPLKEVTSQDLSQMGSCLIEDGSCVGRRLVFPDSQFKPMQASLIPICSLDANQSIWIDILSNVNSAVSKIVYLGLPEFLKPSQFPKKYYSYLGSSLKLNNTELQTFWRKYFTVKNCCVEFMESLSLIEDTDLIIWNPLSIFEEDYISEFREEVWHFVLQSLRPTGTLLITLDSQSSISPDSLLSRASAANLTTLVDYPVSDSLGDSVEEQLGNVIIAAGSQSTVTRKYLQSSVEKQLISSCDCTLLKEKTLENIKKMLSSE